MDNQNQNPAENIIELFGNDKDLALFFSEWCRNGLNAMRAYLTLYPTVDEHSAETLGSRMLRKVEVGAILTGYGLGIEEYFKQLKMGLQARQYRTVHRRTNDKVIEVSSPDHKTRRVYHVVLGKLLGLEKEKKEAASVIPVEKGYFDRMAEAFEKGIKERGTTSTIIE